jgi:CDP-diacylglycerol---serine O-phosphatidyltransferase
MNKQIPNLITALNLACGLFALHFLSGDAPVIDYVLVYVGWALVFDFLDGFVARLMGVSSPMGKQLDSLADMVTFGVVPGFVMFHLLNKALVASPDVETPMLVYASFLIPIGSAWRLAKFNVDPRQSDSFFGLPTPANTILVLSYWAITESQQDSFMTPWLQNVYVLVGLSALSALLMNMDVRLIALKFKSLDFGPNKFRYLLVLLSAGLLIWLQFLAVPLVIVLYLVLSLIENSLSDSAY